MEENDIIDIIEQIEKNKENLDSLLLNQLNENEESFYEGLIKILANNSINEYNTFRIFYPYNTIAIKKKFSLLDVVNLLE